MTDSRLPSVPELCEQPQPQPFVCGVTRLPSLLGTLLVLALEVCACRSPWVVGRVGRPVPQRGVSVGAPQPCRSDEKGTRQGGRLSRRGASSHLPKFQRLESVELPSMLEGCDPGAEDFGN